MEVTLSEDQEFFRETTHRFLETECDLAMVRSLVGTEAGFEDGYWRQGADLGWTSMLVAEADGGGTVSGGPMQDLAIVADAFGHHVAPGPLLPVNVVAGALSRCGTDEQKASLLPGLLSGESVAAWCGVDDDPYSPTMNARVEGDAVTVSGESSLVESGSQASMLLVAVMTPDGPAQVLVPVTTAGVALTPLHSLDATRRYASVEFDDVSVPVDSILGGDGGGSVGQAIDRQFSQALAIQVSEMAGAAQRAFEITVEWAFDRYSFGRPLASYQELKHRFADMATWLEASHALAAAAARELDDESPRAAETASIAKAYQGEFMAELAQDCIQIHGGIGLTMEHDLHLFVRRVIVGRSALGTPAVHRRRVALRRIAAVENEDAA